MSGGKSGWLAHAAMLAAMGLAGCASQDKLRQAELATLAAALPGTYDNAAQAREDVASGAAAPHAGLRLMITEIYAPVVGARVFHVRETSLDDPRRLVMQRIWTLSLSPDKRLTQGVMALAEPERWRTGDPELFRSLLPQDLRPLAGCELYWTATAAGFSGQNQHASCRADASASDEARTVEYRAELQGDQLALSERQYDAAGRIVMGDSADPFYRFVRRGR